MPVAPAQCRVRGGGSRSDPQLRGGGPGLNLSSTALRSRAHPPPPQDERRRSKGSRHPRWPTDRPGGRASRPAAASA